MPNTPVMVNAGMSAICPNEYVSKDELDQVCSLFSLFGEYEMMEEEDFDAFIALCGSSPAYIFVLIEAMADAAVKLGLPRKSAYRMAEQAILGSAKLALETGSHPAELKDMVCSPGGSTIVAVAELETQGFRAAIMKAMEKCAEKSKNQMYPCSNLPKVQFCFECILRHEGYYGFFVFSCWGRYRESDYTSICKRRGKGCSC